MKRDVDAKGKRNVKDMSNFTFSSSILFHVRAANTTKRQEKKKSEGEKAMCSKRCGCRGEKKYKTHVYTYLSLFYSVPS